MRSNRARFAPLLLGVLLALASVSPSFAVDDSEQILAIDHLVSHVSTAPATSGQEVKLYVRERVQAGVALTSPSFAKRVVLFVHGATIPSEVGFDAQYQDYSWMAYLAQAGLDAFALDLTGYGPSSRPTAMDDPCNVAPASQSDLVPSTLADVCPSTYAGDLTTLASDRDDIDAVVDYVRSLRHVEKISLVKGWPQNWLLRRHPPRKGRQSGNARASVHAGKPARTNACSSYGHHHKEGLRRQLGQPDWVR
jgi:hypothetical protein